MVIPSGRTLFGLAAAFVLSSVAPAQDVEFAEAIKLLRMDQKEEALAKLREVLQLDPSNEDALRLYRNTDQDIWYMLLLEEGEIGQIAQSLLERAKMQRRELSRDEGAIAALVDLACSSNSSFAERNAAVRSLVSDHGEFAVPALIEFLRNSDDEAEQLNVIVALYKLGAAGTLPLIEALHTDDANVRRTAAAALSQIGDPRAAAALARLVRVDDQESVRDIARRTLPKLGVDPGADPVRLFLGNARSYLQGRGPGEASEVSWNLVDGRLVPTEVPGPIYPLELAKKNAHAALILDPLSQDALTLVAQTYLAQIAVISESLTAGDPDFEPFAEKLDSLRWVAMATGPRTLQLALDDALARDLGPVAVGAIEALELAAVDEEPSVALAEAVQNPNSTISVTAALALASLGRDLPPEQAREVVAVLGQAVTQESIKVIKVIDSAPTTRQVAAEASGRGLSYQVVDSAVTAISELYSFPNVDVVVINEVLDRLPEDVIGLIRKDSRMEQVKILVVASDVDAAMDRFGDTIDGVIEGPLNAQNLPSEVEAVLEGIEMDQLRSRADRIARSASEALMNLANGQVNVSPALGSLTTQLDRPDDIAVPAAKAIGAGGTVSQLGPLLTAMESSSTSLELKIACADAAGRIMGRASEISAEVYERMMSVLESEDDSGLRLSVATALGKAPLVPGNRLRLMELLRTVAER